MGEIVEGNKERIHYYTATSLSLSLTLMVIRSLALSYIPAFFHSI
jgi:hypothetical protein